MDTHLRSLTKGMSWRVIATLVTTAVVWLISGEVSMAVFAGLCDSLIKIGLFWGHERGWQKVGWGRENISQEANIPYATSMKNEQRELWAARTA